MSTAAGEIAVPSEIFKAYDIRGVVGKTLTVPLVGEIGRGLGTMAAEVGQEAIVVGRDGRHSGAELAGALADGIRACGVDVIDLGAVPTPLVYFATHTLDTASGVAVTGSHNPPEYNGLKMVVAGNTLSGEAIQALRRRVRQRDFHSGAGRLHALDLVPAYVERVVSDTELARPMRVVIDCGNGIAGRIAGAVFRGIGCEVTELYCEVDGDFPNHHPDPSDPDNLVDLIAAVHSGDADLGLAFDGDGDRLGVVTPGGRIIWADRQMVLFARDVLSRFAGAEIIYDVKCSRILPRAIEDAGGRATMWRTGHSLIKAKMRTSGAPLAGEMSGHIFFGERWYGFDDGIYAGVRLVEILSRRDESPEQVFAAIPDTVNTPELRLELPEGEHHRLVERLLAVANFPDAEVSTIDGLRVDFDAGFGLARASNTTPTVILRFEGSTPETLALYQERFRQLLLSVAPGLELPF